MLVMANWTVPGSEDPFEIKVTREQLEEAIKPVVDRMVVETQRAISKVD